MFLELETEPRGPETEAGGLETKFRVHKMHGTKLTGLRMILRSLVAPHKEQGGASGSAIEI